MSALLNLSAVSLRGLVFGAVEALGLLPGAAAVEPTARFLYERFTANAALLILALQRANDRAWLALECALARDVLLAEPGGGSLPGFVRAYLNALPVTLVGTAESRRQALHDLRQLDHRGDLGLNTVDLRLLARQSARFAQLIDSQSILTAEQGAIEEMGKAFSGDSTTSLRPFLLLGGADGISLLAAAARWELHQQLETDPELSRTLAFSRSHRPASVLDPALAALDRAASGHADSLRRLLDAAAGHSTNEVEGLLDNADQLLRVYGMSGREIRPGDSLVTIDEADRRAARDLIQRYRDLPSGQRDFSLQLKIGAIEVAAGLYDDARRDFDAATGLTEERGLKAEAHYNAFQAALAQRDYSSALGSLRQAVSLDEKRFSLFPLRKFNPDRILGAGGYGTAFLCTHKFLREQVVVKTLWANEFDRLDRKVDDVFNEAQVLAGLDHKSIIRVFDCDYVDPVSRKKPYVVMEYFDGPPLSVFIQNKGSLQPALLLPLAQQLADALRKAHERGVLHRDVKPANILVKKSEGENWETKLIDFGLALRPGPLNTSRNTATPTQASAIGASLVGTLRYAAPEQMGDSQGVPIGPHSDFFGFGRTCYYALFGTPEPDDDDKEKLPDSWRRLLSQCTARRLERRLKNFHEVLDRLAEISASEQVLCYPPLEVGHRSREVAPVLSLEQAPLPSRPLPPAGGPRLGAVSAPVRRVSAQTILSGHTATVSTVAFSPREDLLASGSFDDRVGLWKPSTGQRLEWLGPHAADVNCVAFSSDGEVVASSGDDRKVRLWQVKTASALREDLSHPDRVYAVAFHPEESLLATACDDGVVRLWRWRDGEVHLVLREHTSFVRHLAYSHDGKLLATASGDRTIRLWDGDSTRSSHVLTGHSQTVWSVAFSPTEQLLASASQDQTVRLWDLARNEMRSVLHGHSDIVWSVAFSPDGRLLATGSHDRTARLWNVADGKCLAVFEGHRALVRAVAFSPDGRTIATGGGDSTIRIWQVQEEISTIGAR